MESLHRLQTSALGLVDPTCIISPVTSSPIWIWVPCPPRMTLNTCSPSIRSWRPRNWRSFDQSLKAVTNTTMVTAIKIAAPSIHAGWSSSSGSSRRFVNGSVQIGSTTTNGALRELQVFFTVSKSSCQFGFHQFRRSSLGRVFDHAAAWEDGYYTEHHDGLNQIMRSLYSITWLNTLGRRLPVKKIRVRFKSRAYSGMSGDIGICMATFHCYKLTVICGFIIKETELG